MATIPFVKASACGNDFLIIDFAHAPGDICSFTRRICERHNGVGADGIEWVLPANDADLRVRLLNADGSEAEISGNGTRCVAAWYCAENSRRSVVIRTGAGLKRCELMARDGNNFEFRSSMGAPDVGDDFSIKFTYGEISGTPVSMGNPHYVVFVPQFELGWQAVAEQISKHHDFRHGMNVEFVKLLNPGEVEVRFFERGAGETMSSGTGSCAAAVASIHCGKARSPLRVRAPGGTQTVEWDAEVFLTGPATLLCRGEFFI
ncbi:MAG TPA: diaminopimelate epimerase [Candidatus Binatia bacterium]|nr:diaminopimelate epimerase [Candidatus Binatia bacterium]